MGMVERQSAFAEAAAHLIQYMTRPGQKDNLGQEIIVHVTLGDAYRDPRVHGEFGIKEAYGRARSVHKYRMAIDLNLFINGEFQRDSEAHRPYGMFWVDTYGHHKARWGGEWDDGNHYSFEVWGSA